MTTFDPGASVVFTHGLLRSPRLTASRANNAAAIITCGLEVLVQEVIDAITTAPWSSSKVLPSAIVTGVGSCARVPLALAFEAGGADPGKLSRTCSSTPSSAP